jgi:hypothetical protein
MVMTRKVGRHGAQDGPRSIYRRGISGPRLLEGLSSLWRERRYIEIVWAVERARQEIRTSPETVEIAVLVLYESARDKVREEEGEDKNERATAAN